MAVTIHVAGDDGAERPLTFGDDVPYIVLGRDPAQCQVLFASEERTVGREHCALHRVLGRYRLCLNESNAVLVDGVEAVDDLELLPSTELQLGVGGPIVRIETAINPSLAMTVRGSMPRRRRPEEEVREAQKMARSSRRLAVFAVLAAALTAAAFLLLRGCERRLQAERGREADQLRQDRENAIAQAEARQQQRAGELQQEQRQQAEALEQLRQRALTQLEAQKTALAELKRTTRTELDRVEGRLERAASDDGGTEDQKGGRPKIVGPGEHRLRKALNDARPSVYMVVLQFERDGGTIEEDGHGTAWVVGDGVLATNAHVAKIFDRVGRIVPGKENFGTLKQVIVRSGGAAPRSHRIATIDVHPGFAQFEDVWRSFQPAQGHTRDTLRPIESPGNACDVALLNVAAEDRDSIGPALTLAAPHEVSRLDAGDLVGFLGYPMENMALVNPRFPSPQTQIGRVSGITDYFGINRRDAAGLCTGHLVQHGLPVTGGASGSPILNESGRVVAVLSGGNMVAIRSGRISVGFNFGQRVDLVVELLEGRAQAAQRDRTRAWRQELPRLFDSGTAPMRRELPKRIVSQHQRDWAARLDPHDIVHWKGELTGENGLVFEATSEEVQPGKYLAFAIADSADEIKLSAVVDGGEESVDCSAHEPHMTWAQVGRIDVTAPKRIRFHITGERAGTTMQLYLVGFRRREAVPAGKIQTIVDQWLGDLAENGNTPTATEVTQEKGRLPEPDEEGLRAVSRHRVTLDEAGAYLALAAAPGRENIDIFVMVDVDGDDRLIALDTSPDCYPSAAFKVDKPGAAQIRVAGDDPDVAFEFRLYRAREGRADGLTRG